MERASVGPLGYFWLAMWLEIVQTDHVNFVPDFIVSLLYDALFCHLHDSSSLLGNSLFQVSSLCVDIVRIPSTCSIQT
jgi:hypothetical protein